MFSFPLIFVLFSLSVSNANECGQVDIIQGAILNGKQTLRGEWPFLAALFNVEGSKFFCGSTVISEKNVLTAAHCIQQKDSSKRLLAEEVVVLLGKHNLQLTVEIGSVQRYVDKIIVHPDWKINSEKYDADLAVLTLSKPVDFTRHIRAICMPGDDDNEHFQGVDGSIVGWGVSEFTERNHEYIPRHTVSTVLNDSYCYTSNYLFALISSQRTFCGSGEQGTVSTGDSGGGFFVRFGSSWVQYGVISVFATDKAGYVPINSTAVYTKVKPFKSWIQEIVRLDGSEVMTLNDERRKINIVLDCKVIFDLSYNRYICETYSNFDINTKVVSVNVLDGDGHSAEDIAEIRFNSRNNTNVPDGIGNVFKNLKIIKPSHSKLKLTKRSNFKNMPHLTLLALDDNQIETFDEDTLWDLPNLTQFFLTSNKVKAFHKDMFAKNSQLVGVYANYNELEFIHRDLFKSNLLIWVINLEYNKLKIIEIDIRTLRNLKYLSLSGNVCINDNFNNFTGNVDIEKKNEFQTLLTNLCSR